MATIFGKDCVRSLTDVEDEAVRIADVLRERGVRPGDRVMLKAQNSVGYLTALLALIHADTSMMLIDVNEHPRTTGELMLRAGVTLSIVDEEAAIPDDGTPSITVFELQLAAAGRVPSGTMSAADWSARPDGLLMCSSGSTGVPKVIVKSGGSFLTNLRRNIDLVGHVQTDVLAPLLPFSHQYGLSMVLIAWLARCSLVVATYWRLDHAVRTAGQCGATVFDATPATYRSIFNLAARRPALGKVIDNARMLCVGAAPLDSGLVDRYVTEYGKPLLDSYGSTELGNVSFATTEVPVACGRAVDGVALAIHGDDGAELPPGEVGEVMVLTPDVMAGYLGDDGRLQPVRPGWYPTGDLGHLDDQGNLFVLGRKRAVHRMGYTLHPEMIERKVSGVGCSAKIVAVPDDRIGARLIAFVEDEENRDAAFWRERITGALPAYEVPNKVVVIDSFPLNRNGKPDNRRLEEMAASV